MTAFMLYDVFLPSCKRHGIKLMPDDMRFITKQLKNIPKDRHRIILRKYREIWLEAMKRPCYFSNPMNIGRKAANSYLLDLCDD
jgi:hypothetical protein